MSVAEKKTFIIAGSPYLSFSFYLGLCLCQFFSLSVHVSLYLFSHSLFLNFSLNIPFSLSIFLANPFLLIVSFSLSVCLCVAFFLFLSVYLSMPVFDPFCV